MSWNVYTILMLVGALHGLFLSCLIIFANKKNRKAGYFLAALLFGVSFHLLYSLFIATGLSKIYPLLKSFYLPWFLWSSVCFYLYVKFTGPFETKFTIQNKLLFLPFLVISVMLIIIRICMNTSDDMCGMSLGFIHNFYVFDEYFGMAFALFFGWLTYKKIGEIERRIRNEFAGYNEFKLRFHRQLLKLAMVFCVIWFITYSRSLYLGEPQIKSYYILWLFLAVIVQWIAWSGFIRDDLLLKHEQLTELSNRQDAEPHEQPVAVKNQRFGTDHPLYAKLIELFTKDQVYLDSKLSLQSLADQMEVSKSYVSALINETTGGNFYDMVNQYRVNHFVEMLNAGKAEEFTLLALAYQSGFNSKSTFQSAFKKITGKTPTNFLNELKGKSGQI